VVFTTFRTTNGGAACRDRFRSPRTFAIVQAGRPAFESTDAITTWGPSTAGIYTFPTSGPSNNTAPQEDQIVSCAALIAKYGLQQLTTMGMPCSQNSPAANSQATSRSMHPMGVHILLLDGSAQYVSEDINPQIWQALHSKDNGQPFELPFGD
jgi:Protein of unknown function (DUF1559)